MNTARIFVQTATTPELPLGLTQTQHGGFVVIHANSIAPAEFKDAWFLNDDAPLPTLAKKLSVHGPSLAVLNWQDEWLRLWAYHNNQLGFRYDSNPSYATCTVSPAEFNDPATLANLFNKTEAANGVSQLLARRKGLGFINESGRLRALAKLLGFAEALE